ncbi:MAG: CoA transferase, partial [Myxococcota bacterium]
MAGPLAGVRIVDVSQILSGPFACMILADQNREALGKRVLEEIRKWTTKELIERMAAEQVPVGPVYSIEEMLEDPQIRHNEVIYELEHPEAGRLRQVRPPARFSVTQQPAGGLAPALGEHT